MVSYLIKANSQNAWNTGPQKLVLLTINILTKIITFSAIVQK